MVYVHVDCDCFYAQCEELRNPTLKNVPVGITQKYLIVTCNYNARARGVTKLMGIKEAQRLCPEIVLVDGSDLTPYKSMSDCIVDLLHVYGKVKRLGCDEMFVDVTDEVSRRLSSGTMGPSAVTTKQENTRPNQHVGHLWLPGKGSTIRQDSIHRVMDLRAIQSTQESHDMDDTIDMDRERMLRDVLHRPTTQRVFVGSQVASDIRRVVMSATRIRMSAGIATSQIMAKLISGLHKPNDQTILLPEWAKDFLADLHVRVIPGVGSALAASLATHGVAKVSDLWSWTRTRLIQTFGEKQGVFLYLASRGIDHADALIEEPRDGGFVEPKSVSVEDSLRICSGFTETTRLVQKLSPDLVYRIHNHAQKYGKIPTTLTVTYRMKEAGMHERHACSTTMPQHVDARSVTATALSVLQTKIQEPFHLSLLNIAAKNFRRCSAVGMTWSIDPSHPDEHQETLLKSKRECRMARESANPQCKARDHDHEHHDDGEDASFWRDLNDVSVSGHGRERRNPSTVGERKRVPPATLATTQRKKITSFFQKKQ